MKKRHSRKMIRRDARAALSELGFCCSYSEWRDYNTSHYSDITGAYSHLSGRYCSSWWGNEEYSIW